MGMKYEIHAKNYETDYWAYSKQTRWLVIAIVYFISTSMKFEAVNLMKRK